MANDLLQLWKALQPMVEKDTDTRARDCVRMQKMTVTTAYNATTKTIGVSIPFGEEVQLPVWGGLNPYLLSANDTVWVLVPYSDFSNAIVFMTGDGSSVGSGDTGSLIFQTESAIGLGAEPVGAERVVINPDWGLYYKGSEITSLIQAADYGRNLLLGTGQTIEANCTGGTDDYTRNFCLSPYALTALNASETWTISLDWELVWRDDTAAKVSIASLNPENYRFTVQLAGTIISGSTVVPTDNSLGGHLSLQFVPTSVQLSNIALSNGIRLRMYYFPTGYVMRYRNAKLERGSAETGFSLAPEDVLYARQYPYKNLLKNTGDCGGTDWQALTNAAVSEPGAVKLTPTTTLSRAIYKSDLDWTDYHGIPYTLSFDAREISEGTYASTRSADGIQVAIGYRIPDRTSAGDTFNVSYDRYANVNLPGKGTGWHRYYLTIREESFTTGVDTALAAGSLLTVGFNAYKKTRPFEIRRVKLEQGTVATEWNPAPSDPIGKPWASFILPPTTLSVSTTELGITLRKSDGNPEFGNQFSFTDDTDSMTALRDCTVAVGWALYCMNGFTAGAAVRVDLLVDGNIVRSTLIQCAAANAYQTNTGNAIIKLAAGQTLGWQVYTTSGGGTVHGDDYLSWFDVRAV